MPLPVDSLTFDGPCYLTYGLNSKYSTASFDLSYDGTTKTVTLDSETFTEVQGICLGVTIKPEGGEPFFFPVQGITEVGPNAWGILQITIVPGGGFGFVKVDLALETDGTDASVNFITPPVPSDVASTLPPYPQITIIDGGVYNGVSDNSEVSMFSLISAIPIPPSWSAFVPPGKEIGGIFAGLIFAFKLKTDKDPARTWYPAEAVLMLPSMSLVVIGDYNKPQLAIMEPTGKVQIVDLRSVL
jgi:hypothetical protein